MVALGAVAADRRGRPRWAAAVVAHTSVAFQQRVRNRHPDGGLSGDGHLALEQDLLLALRARRASAPPTSARRCRDDSGGRKLLRWARIR